MSDETLDETTQDMQSEGFVAPETGVEKEKKRKMIVDANGLVSGEGLDDLEKYIFDGMNLQLSSNLQHENDDYKKNVEFWKNAIVESGNRLGFEIDSHDTGEDREFNGKIYDSNKIPSYKVTDDPEGGTPITYYKDDKGLYAPIRESLKDIPELDSLILNSFRESIHAGALLYTRDEAKRVDERNKALGEATRRLGYVPRWDTEKRRLHGLNGP
ncbi:TPA: hypothetical protein DD449_02680 [Candidatus Berkelbacteria bacterium]|uniref:Uncharacterized protein n=1 Tax=Berkelbacteria bacterium GW2011_GWE1_39_12 TaxID=1618337 RepID=A0A0G4B3Q1_9BACT|nr:MAG: hypothetical protein UT28_C0001G0237 [Berkelbacteria bacterium GW2011_GWE1_39_12]HBO60562.1 hypothetical protein [Candidatus Berkelbacteria bacterium]